MNYPYYQPPQQPQYNNYQLQQVQDRLNQFQMQNPQFMQQQMQPQMQQQMQPQMQQNSPTIKPVTSIEEIKAITPAFDGSKMYFENVTNKELYIRYINLNGLPVTDVYKLNTEATPKDFKAEDFVTKTEFEDLKVKIEKYEKLYGDLMGGGKNE